MYHISTTSDLLRQGVDSLAQWLKHLIFNSPDVFQTMHNFLVTNFHIRKMGALRKWSNESFKNDFLIIINDNSLEIGVWYVPLHHSVIRNYTRRSEWQITCCVVRLFDSDILRQGVDSLAQWLEHWISTRGVGFLQTMHHLSDTNFHIRKIFVK